MTILQTIISEFKLQPFQAENTLALFANNDTVPFIARYRKEVTGGLDEIQLRAIEERFAYLTEIEKRKETVLKQIEAQGKLTDQLRDSILACTEKSRLEDLYLPFKPKRKTRAAAAAEKGLEPLFAWIMARTDANADIAAEAQNYVNPDKGVGSVEEALAGARDILAEKVAETAENRALVRDHFFTKGLFVSRVRKDYEGKKTKFEMYYEYSSPVRAIPSHNMLALRRAESEGVVLFDIAADDAVLISALVGKTSPVAEGPVAMFIKEAVADGYNRLLKNSITAEVRVEKKHEADREAILTFEKNLRELLLSPPAGHVPIVAVDPGFRTGCKVVCLDETGKFLEYKAIFPHEPQKKRAEAEAIIRAFIEHRKPKFIVVGNGTAARETELFLREAVRKVPESARPAVLIVSEAGASVYSASQQAIDEFPNLDVTVRGAISIGRRLLDPLAELVKIDPKSIGVGQYQHDVDQTLLKKKLSEVVESCVNFVGVDLNFASVELLSYVAGLKRDIAANIVAYRNEHGAFTDRKQLLDVPKLGKKAFENAAGFLRIRNGVNPLDNSAVHPESYGIVERMAAQAHCAVQQLIANTEALAQLNARDFTTESAGLETVKDIINELRKPGRDPRAEFVAAKFRDDVTKISDLSKGMILEGVVTNVANFGAFVDIGVHQDGLVHISKMGKQYVKDPNAVVKVGQIVKVKVVDIDEALSRISLSMNLEDEAPAPEKRAEQRPTGQAPRYLGPQKGRDGDRRQHQQKHGPQQHVQGSPAQKPMPQKPQRPQEPKKTYTLQDLIKKFNG